MKFGAAWLWQRRAIGSRRARRLALLATCAVCAAGAVASTGRATEDQQGESAGTRVTVESPKPGTFMDSSQPADYRMSFSLAAPDRAFLEIPPERIDGERLRGLQIERGKSAVLEPSFPVRRVAIGDPEIADVIVLSPHEIQVVSKQVGDTNLILWGKGNDVEAAIDLHIVAPHSRLQTELRRILELDSVNVDGAGGAVVLNGTVASPIDVERAQRIAEAFYPTADDKRGVSVINMLEVGGNQQVMISIIIAEMGRSVRRNLGTNFAGVTSSGDTAFSLFSFLGNLTQIDAADDLILLSQRINFVASIVNGSDSLDLFIEALQQQGLVKILAEPSLIARSGEPARFLVGGEVPIPIPQSGVSDSITIEFKEFGVAVSFTPTVLTDERIHLNVATEVSKPVPIFGVEVAGFSVPSFNTRRASTGVDLGDGETFAIAGLLREDVDEQIQEFPFFGDIPILGALFRSTSFLKEETELVIVVTPHLVKPLPPGRPALPTDFFIEPSAAEFFIYGSLEGGASANPFGAEPEMPPPPAGPAGYGEPVDSPIAGPVGHRVNVSEAEREEERAEQADPEGELE